MADAKLTGYKLPTNPALKQGVAAQGFVTPKQDRTPQIQSIPPKRVLPIIFLPGIMGSNLRMNRSRQQQLRLKSNIAWRPDSLGVTIPQYNDSPTERQLRLDPQTTEVDTYDPNIRSDQKSNEAGDERNDEVHVTFVYSPFERFDGPLLQNDLAGTPNAKSRDQKARERGWGEVYFSSYQEVLTICERLLNAGFSGDHMDVYLRKFVADVAPSKWQAHPHSQLKELDEKTMRKVTKGCWFPVHAMGYNWLQGNAKSATTIAERITDLMKRYQDLGFQCEKVILVTHSMGGLVARAVIHPDIGNLADKVLGIVHGVMPAIGAGAAYKRIRCGFEGSGISSKILGEIGPHVTAVLANAQGGLELLPSQAYGNDWLQVIQKGTMLKSLPKSGDPYEEIYKVRGKWYGLLREEWINPAEVMGPSFNRTCTFLNKAKDFHNSISETYHNQSYAHYGADPERAAWHKVVWHLEKDARVQNVDELRIVEDDTKGTLHMIDPTLPIAKNKKHLQFKVTLEPPAEPGDQTVPLHSADAQFRSGKFKGIFRQSGYEHQASYSNANVLAATLYSLYQIVSIMKWSTQ